MNTFSEMLQQKKVFPSLLFLAKRTGFCVLSDKIYIPLYPDKIPKDTL